MLSNREFGERIGVTHSHASRIRNGRRLPGARTMRRIHEEFGISLLELHDAHRAGAGPFGRLVSTRLDAGK